MIIIVLFLIFLIFTLTIGYFLNKNRQQNIKRSIHNELTTIADLKIEEISKWYADELSDAKTISQNFYFLKTLNKWERHEPGVSIQDIENHLETIKNEHDYSALHLVSTTHQIIASTNKEFKKIDPVLNLAIDQTILTNQPVSTDLFLSQHNQEIHLNFVAPLYNDNGDFLGSIVFEIDPDDYLYPYINKVPFSIKSAETILLRYENDSILFLNEMRLQEGTALKLKIPKSTSGFQDVNFNDELKRVYEGTDYREQKVMFYMNQIPGTPWFMVAKVDKNELYQRLKINYYISVATMLLTVVIIFFILAFIYSYFQKNLFKSLWLSQEEIKITLYSIGDAVITTDKNGLIKNLNPVAEKLTGWSERDAIGQPIETVFRIVHERTREIVLNPVSKVIEDGKIVSLSNHTMLISRSGTETPIADSGAPIFNEAHEIIGVVLVFRDQTDERNHLRLIEEQKRQLYTLMSNLPGMAYRSLNDESWTMQFVSKGCRELTGYDDEELLLNKAISYSEIIHPDDKKMVWEKVQEAISKYKSFELEYRILTKTREICWVWEKGQGVYDEEMNLVAIEGFINNINKRKKFESALNSSEQLFHTLAENSSVGIFKTNAHGYTTYVNPKWCNISGMEAHEALGDGWMMSVHPDDIELLKNNWNNSKDNCYTSVDEYRFVHPNGSIVHVKGQAVPEFDNGDFMGYIGTITDITDIKMYEEKLKSSNLLLSTLVENLPDAVYIKDREGRKLLANKADLDNIGISDFNKVIGKTDFDLFPEEIARKFWEIDKRVIENGEQILNFEEKLINQNNITKWLSTSKIPYRNSEGKIIGLIGIGHDITRRKKDKEDKLKLVTALTQSPVSILITDKNGLIEYVNPKFCEVSGYSSDEVIGKNSNILKSGKQSRAFYEQMWLEILNGKEFHGEFNNKKKNGELFWEKAIIAPIKLGDEIINFVAVKEDITERKQMMAELVKAKNKAEESEKLKSSFLANMSHEIRTPLNSILGFSNILIENNGITEDERDVFTSVIQKSSDSLLQIINDIIDISSLETGQLKIYKSEVKLNEMLNILFNEFSQRMNEMSAHNIQLIKLEAPKEITIFADRNRLNQIFTNLITNSLKFTENGFIEFGIEKYDRSFVYFKVKDTGIGIPAEMHQAIFERFRQAEENIIRHYGGNGLGLAIVKNLIELMGGEITVESEPDKGSVFRFSLPVKGFDA